MPSLWKQRLRTYKAKVRFIAALFALLYIVAVAVAPQQVTVDWIRGTDFSSFKTYNWRLSPQPVQDVTWNARIISFVDAQLAAKGLKKAAPDQPPDLIVRYIAGAPRSPQPSERASLKIHLANPKTAAVVWVGLATDVLGELSDKDAGKVQNAIQEMFRDYPPGK